MKKITLFSILFALSVAPTAINAALSYPGFIITSVQESGKTIIKIAQISEGAVPYSVDVYAGKDRSSSKIVAKGLEIDNEAVVSISNKDFPGQNIITVCATGEDCRTSEESNALAFENKASGGGLMAGVGAVFGKIFDSIKGLFAK